MYDNNAARLMLGVLTIKPYLLNEDKYNLTEADFDESTFHKRIFQGVRYLANHGARAISAMELYELAERSQEVINTYKENDLEDFVYTTQQLTNVDNVDTYYNAVRKCTIINEYKKHGFDTARFEAEPAKYEIEDIISYYEGLQIDVKKNFYHDKNIEEVKAGGDALMAIKDGFKVAPMWGSPFMSAPLTNILRGWQKGQLTCISCGSGMGKSTFGLAQLVMVCSPRIYNESKHCYVDNPYCEHHGGMVIQYEMNAMQEVSPRLLSTISGVPCFHILNGAYDDGEEERVNEAVTILGESNIYIVTMPQFTVDLVDSYVKDYVINKDVRFLVFDYISEQASASLDLVKKSGTQQRTDQILAQIASKLKDIAVMYSVAVLTFTQVNATINTAEVLDAGVVASSRAVQNKLDCGVVMHSIRPNEQIVVDMMLEAGKYGITKFSKPNRVLHVYKARFGSYDPNLKVYINLDLSTGRVVDYFVTDRYDQEYNKVPLKIDQHFVKE